MLLAQQRIYLGPHFRRQVTPPAERRSEAEQAGGHFNLLRIAFALL